MIARAQQNRRIEWATLGLFAGFYAAWLAVILLHRSLPWPASVAASGTARRFLHVVAARGAARSPDRVARRQHRPGLCTAVVLAAVPRLPLQPHAASPHRPHRPAVRSRIVLPSSRRLGVGGRRQAGLHPRHPHDARPFDDRRGPQHRPLPVARDPHHPIQPSCGTPMGCSPGRRRRCWLGGSSWSSAFRSGSTSWGSS